MGAKLVNGALTQYPDVAPPARILLVTMCLYAKDSEQQPRSYLGQQNLCAALGYEPTPSATGHVRRYLRSLVAAGAITRTRTGGRSRTEGAWRSEFVLNVRPVALSAGLRTTGPDRAASTGPDRAASTGPDRAASTGPERASQLRQVLPQELSQVRAGETASSSAPSVTLRWADE